VEKKPYKRKYPPARIMRFTDPILYELVERCMSVLFYARLATIAAIAIICGHYKMPVVNISVVVILVVIVNLIGWLKGNWEGEKEEDSSMPGTNIPQIGEPIILAQPEYFLAGKVLAVDTNGSLFAIELPDGKVTDWIRCEDPQWTRGGEGMAAGIWEDIYHNYRGCKPRSVLPKG
jgi:hypothetical protein